MFYEVEASCLSMLQSLVEHARSNCEWHPIRSLFFSHVRTIVRRDVMYNVGGNLRCELPFACLLKELHIPSSTLLLAVWVRNKNLFNNSFKYQSPISMAESGNVFAIGNQAQCEENKTMHDDDSFGWLALVMSSIMRHVQKLLLNLILLRHFQRLILLL